jgi:hypothetical protein
LPLKTLILPLKVAEGQVDISRSEPNEVDLRIRWRNVSLKYSIFPPQLEKQQKLNELDIVVSLKLHQIQHIINGVLPQDLVQCLVFEAPGVVHLQRRIKELEQEKNLQKKQQK